MKILFNKRSYMARWRLILIMFQVIFSLSGTAYALEPWSGIFFSPQANTNNDHQIFLTDFEAMVKTLKAKGLNTIVFDMNYGAYHFTSDAKLNSYSYSVNKGFTSAEAKRMAEIVRNNGMQVMVALQVLTHSVGNVYPYVYPEYMLPGKTWLLGILYKANVDYVQYGGRTYKCITDHTSDTTTAPPASGYWQATPSSTRDPFNKDGEALVFKMIDELVTSFTINGVKPEGFHIGSDELWWWYDTPELTTGKSSAQIYAMAITNAYNHIKAINPNMEVIMWGDMLDPYWNGSQANKNTSGAIDLIPKGLIVADWRYTIYQPFRYDSVIEIFPSVGEFINKGFRVWPTSWENVKGTTDLVWTGNMEQAKSGKVMGHLYTTWLGGIVPELNLLLADPNYQVPDYALPVTSDSDKLRFRQYYRGLADSINATSNLIGLKQCRGTEFFCGTYPNCENNTIKNGVYGIQYRIYYCKNNSSLYDYSYFPNDYISYWQFNGDATDVTGRNNGTLMNDATIVNDTIRGQVVNFAGSNDYVRVKDNDLLDMGTSSLSISAWFKTGISTGFGAIMSKKLSLTVYTLLLHQDGRILLETNANNFFRYSANGINFRDSKWHHVVAIFDSSVPTINIYVDGVLSNGTSNFLTGNNIKSSTSDLFIGNNNGSGQYEFQGSLDDIMIYSRALLPTEVKFLYTVQKTSPINLSPPTNFRLGVVK